MEYVTTWERNGIKIGIKTGALQKAREDIVEVLDARWGVVSPSLVAELDGIADPDILKRLHRRAVLMNSPEGLLDEELSGVA